MLPLNGNRGLSDRAAREAWGLFWRIFMEDKRRRWAILSELGISPQQSMAITPLQPGEPMPMSALADALHCDNSNVTGIVDRLEAAGLAERRAARARPPRQGGRARPRRASAHAVEIERRAGEPPPRLAALPEEDAVALRDILARALDRACRARG